jgi:8-oxo-dGTP diphosphatase
MGGQGRLRVAVAIAVLRREGRILVRRRREGEHLAGLWEFPGGKIRRGESALDAARREVCEEMGIEAIGLEEWACVAHHYDDRSVSLHVFEGSCSGEPEPADGASFAWVTPEELAELPIPDANRALVAQLLQRSAASDPRTK